MGGGGLHVEYSNIFSLQEYWLIAQFCIQRHNFDSYVENDKLLYKQIQLTLLGRNCKRKFVVSKNIWQAVQNTIF